MKTQPKTTIKRHPERSVPEEYRDILIKGLVAHVGYSEDRQPYVIPLLYHYEVEKPECIYLHGAPGSTILRHLANGNPACVEVTLVQQLIYSRTALDHSMNYQSAVCFGRARRIQKQTEKALILEKMISRYFPGRSAGRDYEAPTQADLKSTSLLEFKIETWSAKARRGGPNGPYDADKNAPGSAGVVELKTFV